MSNDFHGEDPTVSRREALATRLSALRRDRGWTQAELARRAGINRNVVNTTENQTSFPTRENINRIASALGIEPEVLNRSIVQAEMKRNPSLDLSYVTGSADIAYLRINRLVRSETALEIHRLILRDGPEADLRPSA